MRSSRRSGEWSGWRALFDEARRREVHRALAIYGAVVWAVVAAAPDLLGYVAAPPWAFRALLVVLGVGFPVVVVASWMLDFSVKGESPPPELGTGSDAVVTLTPEDVHRLGPGARQKLLRWVVPIAVVVTLSFFVRWAVTMAPARLLTVAFQEGSPHAAALRPPLESLLAARTVLIDVADGSPSSLRSARRAGAAYLVTSDTVGGENGTLTIALYDATSEERLLVRYGGGANETMAAAAGRLALELVRSLADFEDASLTFDPQVTLQTESPIALFQFLEGERRFAMAQFDAAAASFRRAIEADSGFVPAYYRLAVTEQWRWDYAEGWEVLELAVRRGISSPAWRRLVEAQRQYLERDAAAALDAYQLVTLHHPELREGWLGLGEALYHFGGFLGHVPGDASTPLRRGLERDSVFAPVAHHLVELALWGSAPDSAERALTWMTRDHPVRPVMEAALAIETGSDEERAAAWRIVSGWDLRLLSLLVAHFGFHPEGRELADSTAGVLVQPNRFPEERLRGAQYRLMLAADDSSWSAALALWREVRTPEPFDTWVVHAYHAGRAVPEAAAMLEWAEEQHAAGRIPDFDLPVSDDLRRALNALVHEAVLRGDSVRVQRLLQSLEDAGPGHPTDPGPEILPAALRARLALLAADTTRAVEELRVATLRTFEPFVAFYPSSTMAPERLLLLRLSEALGRAEEAARWRASFFNSLSFGDLAYRSLVDGTSAISPPPQGGP